MTLLDQATRAVADRMGTFMSRAVGISRLGFVENFAVLPRVAIKTASYTVKGYETGSIFTTFGATAAVEFTLPDPAEGSWIFLFVNGADVNMKVKSATADDLITFNDLAADDLSFETASELIGGAILAFSDGTSPYALSLGLGGHVQTATVNT